MPPARGNDKSPNLQNHLNFKSKQRCFNKNAGVAGFVFGVFFKLFVLLGAVVNNEVVKRVVDEAFLVLAVGVAGVAVIQAHFYLVLF